MRRVCLLAWAVVLFFQLLGDVEASERVPFFEVPYDEDALPFGTSFHYLIELDGEEIGISTTRFRQSEIEDGEPVVVASYIDVLLMHPDFPSGYTFEFHSKFRLKDFLPLRYVDHVRYGNNFMSGLSADFDWDEHKLSITSMAYGETASGHLPLSVPMLDSVSLMAPLLSWKPSEGDQLLIFLFDSGQVVYTSQGADTVTTPLGTFETTRYDYSSEEGGGTVWITDALPRFIVKLTGDTYDYELAGVEGPAEGAE